MIDARTYPSPVIELPLGVVEDPAPIAGCDVCRALASQRASARAAGDMSKVSDLNVEIRNHPHSRRRCS